MDIEEFDNELEDELELFPPEAIPEITPDITQVEDGDEVTLASYAQRAYLEYALSVVKGRALPNVTDGQKPVQRRILYAMARLGLSYTGKNGAKPVKSSRVVGDVLGRFHPHGDQAAYDALVRMAQDFSQRYPLIDGQGNFGSRDGDSAAAMRYTEARLSPITQLLLDEVDQGTIDFVANYDGSTKEPCLLPARLPFVLLNGASGIAVGMSTEIPSHNLAEIAQACVALMRNPLLDDGELFNFIPGPDYPGGGQIINSAQEIQQIYQAGRGSLKVRARWHIEDLARGQWQLVIDELPPNVSSQRILEEIEEISNPKIRVGKKAISNEQTQLKTNLLAVLDAVRDESNQEAPIRLVIEPRSNRVSHESLLSVLLVHTSLESSSSINLTSIGIDGIPVQKSLRQMLLEWNSFRLQTVLRRCQHQLAKVQDRIHILEGRQMVLLNIDEVIRIIRQSDEPKPALIASFSLSDRQAEDILEIRLRQLAKLEAIKIEQELKELRIQEKKLQDSIDNPKILQRQVIKEIEADCKQFADPRRTLIEQQDKASFKMQVQDEPVTVIVSQKGWVRVRQGHAIDTNTLRFKVGDELYASFECRSVDNLFAFEQAGRVFSIPINNLPDGRGDGQPITSLVELSSKAKLLYYFVGNNEQELILSSSAGYGFLVKLKDLMTRQKAGKDFVTINAGEQLCCPSPLRYQLEQPQQLVTARVACVSVAGRVLTFDVASIKRLRKGGRGLMLISLDDDDVMLGAVAYERSICLKGIGRANKERQEILEIRSLNNAFATRARKGKLVNFSFKLKQLYCVQ